MKYFPHSIRAFIQNIDSRYLFSSGFACTTGTYRNRRYEVARYTFEKCEESGFEHEIVDDYRVLKGKEDHSGMHAEVAKYLDNSEKRLITAVAMPTMHAIWRIINDCILNCTKNLKKILLSQYSSI